MARSRILVVEDEEDIQHIVRYNLEKEGYSVICSSSAEDALRHARTPPPDAVVLDLMLPGMDGLEFCRILRKDSATEHTPIIMLTAKSEEGDVVTGLEVGADDYVTKPFSPKVLTARIRAALRRRSRGAAPASDQPVIVVHDIAIDRQRHSVTVGGQIVDLTFTEFRILEYLALHPGWVFTRYQIVDAVRGEDYAVTDRSVDVHVASLRRKLGPARSFVQTVRGVGYRMRE
ncbi:MAG: response regulator transcription factor [Candidatus Eisenbacteria bacterium]|jgi:two-component system phosphate regulon response regulator PhoB|nr:response regulator transcription factor [Candidatus Eisenbacteria bacterium]